MYYCCVVQVENSQAFVWLSQLRHRWDETDKHCFANICDAQFLYSYEYLGNTPRLVITPLTDRYRCVSVTRCLFIRRSRMTTGGSQRSTNGLSLWVPVTESCVRASRSLMLKTDFK